jgi:PAS domain S-box-containing protein
MIPDAAAVLEPMLRDVMTRGEPVFNRELTRPSRTHPGQLQTYVATFFPVRATSGEIMGLGGVVSEVTEAKQAQENLRGMQERMQSILEHTPASIWVKDVSGRIVLANHRLADALGHAYEHVIGRRSEDLLPADVAAQHRAHDLIVLREHRAVEAEEVVPRPDGVRTFLSIKFPLPGDPPMVGGIATDISERKQTEEQLRVAVQSRERVLAAVSHDLRNPLNTIQLTSATLLSQLAGDQRWRRHLEIIHRSCLRMEHLITDLLDMASIGAGRLSIEIRPERANDVLREALNLHQPLADEKRITLMLRALAESVLIECDRQRVMQVFENLVGNALKFCRAGDTVTLGCERADGAVCFWVEDTGPGIQPELLARLFDPYWSGPGSPSGVGLGLYIARGIVERHGGRIDVETPLGRGTRFFFTIPIARTTDSSQ